MPEIFSDFINTAVVFGVLLSLGIVFEDKLIVLEDKFDKWLKGVWENVSKQKEVKSSR